jgi:transposase-like protein
MKNIYKTTLEKLLKEGKVRTIPDIDFMESYKECIDRKNKEFREAKEKEEERISAITCPSCKSTDKEHIVKSNNNGILGPGYHSWIVDEHFVCKKCGVMYKDLNKPKK